MKTDSCLWCSNLETERRVHVDAMDEIHDHFLREKWGLVEEYKRIEGLMKDVLWYNFETVARKWNSPWPQSYADSKLELHGHRYAIVKGRGGRDAEKATFPCYYQGTVRDAPPLPPAIIANELKKAWAAVQQVELNCTAAYDWAPGGRLYEKMLRESAGVQAYRELSSKVDTEGDVRRRGQQAFKDGFRLWLGDPMERETTEDAETTAENILGRVCGDRSLVCSRTRG